MRYHFDKPEIYLTLYGERYICEHPVYNSCTLYRIEERGLAVIQQRFDSETKSTWWSEVDPWITDALYLHPDFREYFEMRAGTCTDGLYPTVTVRQIMWALKNAYRENYLETKDKQDWWQMIQLLPSSYNQRRTVMLNYEVLANIYKSRRNHKLDEWHTFCDWIESLPYSELITGEKKG